MNFLFEVLQVKVVDKPGIYLGVDLDFTQRKGDLFERVLGKMENRLASWTIDLLVFPGRLTLVKHTLLVIPIYLFLGFRAPAYFIKKVRSIIVRFLWGGGAESGIPWMKWVQYM